MYCHRYRKRFALPAGWRGKHIFLYFQGAFQFAEVYLNGKSIQDHETGYTTWTVRLDNASSLRYGAGKANVNTLAVRVDPSFCSGHWYEAGLQNLGAETVFRPRKRMSSSFLLKWGVQILCLFNQKPNTPF